MNELSLSDDLNVVELKANKRFSVKEEKKMLLDLFGCCVICAFDYKPSLQIHHIVPVSKGGNNDIENLTLLCPNCHSLIHSIMSDSAYRIMSADEIDLWVNKTFSSIGKDKVFYYALKLITGRGNDV